MTITDTDPLEVPEQREPNRFLRVASKASIVITILALIGAGITLAVVAINESDRASYWRDLFIEQCIENTNCDVEEEIQAGPAAAGPAGDQGVPGPTGPQGPAGEDGGDGATGAAGAPGEPGAEGADGVDGETGAPGLNGASGEAGAAGANGAGGAPGPAGPAGPAGVNGVDGRGIASLMCGDDGRWQVVYTDGTTADAGACRVVAAPDPEPTEPGIDVPALPIP